MNRRLASMVNMADQEVGLALRSQYLLRIMSTIMSYRIILGKYNEFSFYKKYI